MFNIYGEWVYEESFGRLDGKQINNQQYSNCGIRGGTLRPDQANKAFQQEDWFENKLKENQSYDS